LTFRTLRADREGLEQHAEELEREAGALEAQAEEAKR
jgi:hypothetical protein